jgi:hypothetical protein
VFNKFRAKQVKVNVGVEKRNLNLKKKKERGNISLQISARV